MGTLTCGSKCAKYILFVFNFLFWLTGIALLVAGIWLMVDTNDVEHLTRITGIPFTLIRFSAGIIIAVGIFVFLVGGLGCCSAFKESAGCLTFYALVLIFLLVLQVAAAISAGVFYNKIYDGLGNALNTTIQSRYGVDNATTFSWNFVQIEFKCCGVESPVDWRSSHYIKHLENTSHSQNVHVPLSCCTLNNTIVIKNMNFNNPEVKNDTACQLAAYDTKMPNRTEFINTLGCEAKLNTEIRRYFVPFIVVIVAVILIQLFVVIITCLLKSSIKNAYEYV